MVTLEWILQKSVRKTSTRLIWLRLGAGFRESGIEFSVSIKCRDFLD